MKVLDDVRLDLVGDGYDPEPLLTARQVGAILNVPVKSVYELAIPRVRLGLRRIRWRPVDVSRFIERRVEKP
jgi:predicted DNA-binding transcriptional regulator AlpA